MSRVAVIGGGISGLAAAHRLIELAEAAATPLRVALFEAGPRVGGVIHTESIDDCLVERGADSFITNKPAAIDLCRRLRLDDRLASTDPRYRQAFVLRKGKPVPVPDGFMLMAPAKVWPVVASPIFSPLGKLRLGLERWIPPRTDAADESVASFVRRRLGREALDRLVQPLVAGIYTSDPEKLSLRATLPRFLEMEHHYGSLIRAARRGPHEGNGSAANGTVSSPRGPESGARYGLFVALKAGMAELVDGLVSRIKSGGEIHLDARVCGLNRSTNPQDGFSLAFEAEAGTSTHATDFEAVILALPADRTAELVWPVDSALGAALGEITYASSAIVCTGHSLSDVADPLNGSGLVIPAVEKRRILSVSYASRKFADRAPEGRVVLRTFLGGALQPEILAHSDDELVRIVLSELGEILGVRGEPRFALVSRHERAMPQYHVGHLERVRRIEELASAHPRLALAGNAYQGVGIPDCVASGERAAERVFRAGLPADRRTVTTFKRPKIATGSTRTMNAIVVTFDRLPVGFLACCGNHWIATPNFDRLAAQSVTFQQHFADSPVPETAIPSWWSGRYAWRTEPNGTEIARLPQVLADGGVTFRMLVESTLESNSAETDQFGHDLAEIVRGSDGLDVTAEEAPVFRLVSRAQRDLRLLRTSRKEPWCLWIHSRGIPIPWLAPRDFATRFLDLADDDAAGDESDEGLEDGGGVEEEEENVVELSGEQLDDLLRSMAQLPADRKSRDARSAIERTLTRRISGGYVALLDAALGRLLDSIEQETSNSPTLLIVTAGRGLTLREPGVLLDEWEPLAEESVHTPLFVRPAGMNWGVRRQDLAQRVDLFPTLADWFGIDVSALDFDGSSLLPVVRGERCEWREKVLIASPGSAGVRTSDYYFVRRQDEAETHRLFAKPEDVWETNDLAAQSPEVVEQLSRELAELLPAGDKKKA